MTWLAEHWGAIGTAVGSAGIGGLGWKIVDRWLTHQAAKRKQTDEVAMDLVEKLTARLDVVEGRREADRQIAAAEHAACEARLAALRHELRNVEMRFEAMLTALKHAPEHAAEIVADVMAGREARGDRVDPGKMGALRQETQARMSAERVVMDAKAAGAG